MKWEIRLSKNASKAYKKLEARQRRGMARAIDGLGDDPTYGDVRLIRSGKYQGLLRKRAGRYRIVFELDAKSHLVNIAAILIRSEKTYR